VAVATAADVTQQQSAATPQTVQALSFVEGSVHRLLGAMDLINKQPGGIVGQYIIGTLQPQAQETVGHMQAEITKAADVVKACGGMLWSAEREVEHREEILQSDEGEKFECLAHEHRLHKNEKDACDSYDAKARHLASNTEDFPAPDDRTVKSVGDLLNDAQQFESKFGEIQVAQGHCRDATKACEEQHNMCQVDEETIEKFYCSMKYQRDQACAAYDECYQDAAKKLQAVETKMKELEAHVKDHYKKMSCFEDGVGSIEMDPSTCNHAMIDTVHLDVDYPGAPPEEQCIHLMKQRRDYSSVTCSGGEVVWNPSTTAPPTTAAPTKAPSSNKTDTSPVDANATM